MIRIITVSVFCLPLLALLSAGGADAADAWWKPKPKTTWQWQLTGDENGIQMLPNVEMYDLDLDSTTQTTIDTLHRAGRKVICYFCAGTWENYRSDRRNFPKQVIGKQDETFQDEYWLDIRSDALKPAILARLDKAVRKRCDGVEPDNISGYLVDSGFPLTANDQLRYNMWLAGEAHKRNLSIGLKNDPPQAKALVPFFDWALVESCRQFNECAPYDEFIKAGKAVFTVEYRANQRPATFCPAMNNRGFSMLQKNMDLDAPRVDCLDQSTWNNKLH